MKTTYYSILAAAALISCASAQTATTVPVGYITTTLYGNADSNVEGAATYVSASLVQPTEYAATATESPSGESIITFSGGVPTIFDGKYVLEISNGNEAGWWSTIVSSTATTITIEDVFPADLAPNVLVNVRKFNTVKSLFGANTPGLNPYDEDVTKADEIVILEPGGGVVVIVYLPETVSGEPDKWLDFVNGVSADDYIIYPGTAVKVNIFGEGGLSLVSTGAVKTTPTQTDIRAEENWLGVPIAAGGTLGNMNFFPQLIAYDEIALNDTLVTLGSEPNGQGAVTYVALDETLEGGFMFDFVNAVDATPVSLQAGTGFVLTRDPSQNPSILTIPAQVIGN
jgi:hypothetical protein